MPSSEPWVSAICKWMMARAVATPAIFMPYRMRARYILTLSALLHLPFRVFGALAKFLLDQLEIIPLDDSVEAEHPRTLSPVAMPTHGRNAKVNPAAVVIYSGGTDSTCAAALAAGEHQMLHLLTFYEYATRNSPRPTMNVNRLRERYPQSQFDHHHLSIDSLVKHVSYASYAATIRRHGFMALATCGYSSLSWHVRTIIFCRAHDIAMVYDGLTRELMHFPGHMDLIVEQIRGLYAKFGIRYENPVRDWPAPVDQQLIDRVLVNRHTTDYFLGGGQKKTTGRYLFEQGIFPNPNVKGSRIDFQMQHECYPFALYNVLAFWGYLTFESYESFCDRVARVMADKLAVAECLIDEYFKSGDDSVLRHLLREPG